MGMGANFEPYKYDSKICSYSLYINEENARNREALLLIRFLHKTLSPLKGVVEAAEDISKGKHAKDASHKMDDIGRQARESSPKMDDMLAASEELASPAQVLKELVEKFQLKNI